MFDWPAAQAARGKVAEVPATAEVPEAVTMLEVVQVAEALAWWTRLGVLPAWQVGMVLGKE